MTEFSRNKLCALLNSRLLTFSHMLVEFQTLNLPVERGDSCSSSGSSRGGGGSSRHATPPTESHQLHRIHYIPKRDKLGSDRDASPPESKQQQQRGEGGGGGGGSEKENYSYVQLTAVHEYIYPVMEDQKASSRDASDSLKKRSLEVIPTQPPLLPSKPGDKKKDRHKACQNRCRHCQELYSEDENARGSCEYAPDCVRAGINAVACISCAECMLYHCMADAEGDFAQHPCECGVVDENCGRRWLGLALLSLLVPCLWCYPPLRACHWCCVSCGICGGRHRPASQPMECQNEDCVHCQPLSVLGQWDRQMIVLSTCATTCRLTLPIVK